jgi:hypothetical protein
MANNMAKTSAVRRPDLGSGFSSGIRGESFLSTQQGVAAYNTIGPAFIRAEFVRRIGLERKRPRLPTPPSN